MGVSKFGRGLSSREGLDCGSWTMVRSARGPAVLGTRCQSGLGHGPGLPGVKGTSRMGERAKRGFGAQTPSILAECEILGTIWDRSVPGEA